MAKIDAKSVQIAKIEEGHQIELQEVEAQKADIVEQCTLSM